VGQIRGANSLAELGSDGPGLILLRGGNYSEAESQDCVRRVLMSLAQVELPKSIVVVDRERIRRPGSLSDLQVTCEVLFLRLL